MKNTGLDDELDQEGCDILDICWMEGNPDRYCESGFPCVVNHISCDIFNIADARPQLVKICRVCWDNLSVSFECYVCKRLMTDSWIPHDVDTQICRLCLPDIRIEAWVYKELDMKLPDAGTYHDVMDSFCHEDILPIEGEPETEPKLIRRAIAALLPEVLQEHREKFKKRREDRQKVVELVSSVEKQIHACLETIQETIDTDDADAFARKRLKFILE